MLDTKISNLTTVFSNCSTPQTRYEKIIEIGRAAPPLPDEHQISENLVAGCQSRLYLHTHLQNDKIYFATTSDALISAGLAQLLIRVYSGELPETVLTHKPTYLEDLEIPASLSPSRANGLASLYLRMKREALRAIPGMKSSV